MVFGFLCYIELNKENFCLQTNMKLLLENYEFKIENKNAVILNIEYIEFFPCIALTFFH